MNLKTPAELRSLVPPDADLRHISPDLRQLAVPIAELLQDPRNARRHPEKNLTTIRSSFLRFGQRQALTVNRRNLVTEAGNGRLQVAQGLGWQYIAVSFEDDDAVTATAYGLVDNQSALTAEWDQEVLSGLLVDLDRENFDIGQLGFEPEEVEKLLHDDADDEKDTAESPYLQKIEAPIYRPTGPKPGIDSLCKPQAAQQLLQDVEQSNLSEPEKAFLRFAAYRHLRFDYRAIAEYYAQSGPEMQRLMEASALVIIDWKQAIELGYVQLSQKLNSLGIELHESADEDTQEDAE